MNRKANPQDWMVSPAPLRSRTTPKASGPAKAPMKPIQEWTAEERHVLLAHGEDQRHARDEAADCGHDDAADYLFVRKR